MNIKIKDLTIKIDVIFLILLMLYIMSCTVRKVFYYYMGCYLFIMFHEFSHIITANFFGYKCKKIELSICGMCANIDIQKKLKKDLIIFLIGPISNFVLAAIFNNNKFILSINLSLGIINLLPMYPLDGFRIFECLGINSKIFDFIVYFMFFLLFIYTKNISLIIFVMYIMCIKLKKIRKM